MVSHVQATIFNSFLIPLSLRNGTIEIILEAAGELAALLTVVALEQQKGCSASRH
jgi:hypothetical protein